MSTLELVGLTKHFSGAKQGAETVAVNDINLSVGDGEFLCILGPSGCGKSTTLRMIGGFEEPTSGDVRIDGASVVDMPPNRRPTAMVFQKYTLWPHMRVFDNIAFGLRLRHQPREQIEREVHDSLALVGLTGYAKRFPSQLSGGEQQRVALARALVLQPKILLLDEPFSNLDALLRVRLREELYAIQRRVKITAIFVTHDQEEALSLADRIAVMNAGRLEQLDKPSSIYAYPKTLFVADFIGVMNIFAAQRQDNVLRIGQYALRAVDGLKAHSEVSVAVRPEDFVVGAADTGGTDEWQGTIDQSIDLGHYQKVLVVVPGLFSDETSAVAHRVKVYMPKNVPARAGDRVSLTPTRYLLYSQDAQPVEVRNQAAGADDFGWRDAPPSAVSAS
ncbi:MAG TPA: ABC transporter ATP-binding protein [Anaerolineae bacterium]|jgi:putative spermidine/putrescine transport system ATP-binding protein